MKKIELTMCRKLTLASLLCAAFNTSALGHDQAVHRAITEKAALSSEGLSFFLADTAGKDYEPFTEEPSVVAHPPPASSFSNSGYDPVAWLMMGSDHEDANPLRSANHFYTVLSVGPAGLTDGSESLILPSPIVNSFRWASVRDLREPRVSGIGDLNTESWPYARDYELAALTTGTKAARDESLGHMLYALGHVLHLNQDLSQPDHVRNDNHTRRDWIEKYGRDDYLGTASAAQFDQRFPLRAQGSYTWFTAGFRKLEDFWDRHLYTGTKGALNNDASTTYSQGTIPGGRLGLAEISNGNFLGENAIYNEYMASDPKHLFPFPSLQTSTDFRSAIPGATGSTLRGRYIETVYLKNGVQGKTVFTRKVADGIHVSHHSSLTHTGVKIPISLSGRVQKVSSTIRKPEVFSDYHSILIPKAVEYSGGILDYFFRGYFDIEASMDSTGICTLTVTVYDEIEGGQFGLYYDDSSGNRSTVPGFSSSYPDRLHPYDSFTSTFTPISAGATRYILVYSGGNIGLDSNGNAFDTVDANKAIAVRSFVLLWFQVTNVSDPAANIGIFQDHFDLWGASDSHGGPGGLSPYQWGSVGALASDSRGEYDVQIVSAHNLAADHEITGTLKTFFNNRSAPISTENFTITTSIHYDPPTTPQYYYSRNPIVVDGEFGLTTY